MSWAFLFACLAAMPARAFASRVAAEDAQELPWKRRAVVGALLGGAQLGDVAGFAVQNAGRSASVRLAAAKDDAYAQVQTSLIDIFGVANIVDQEAYVMLMDSLRRNTNVEGYFVHQLEERLRGAYAQSLTTVMIEDDGHGHVAEQLDVPQEGDAFGIAIVRYVSREKQSSEWASEMWQYLSNVERSQSHVDLFVRYFAQSHTAEQFLFDMEGEVLLMREQYFGSLREVMQTGNFEYEERLDVFLEVLRLVQRLHGLGIPHTSAFTPDTVILRGDLMRSQQGNVVLSPDAILADSASSIDDSLKSDIEQLGTLLKFLFSDEVDDKFYRKASVVIAFGTAMEYGAFSGNRNAALEFVHLVEGMSSDMDSTDLLRLKLLYLHWAADAEIAAN